MHGEKGIAELQREAEKISYSKARSKGYCEEYAKEYAKAYAKAYAENYIIGYKKGVLSGVAKLVLAEKASFENACRVFEISSEDLHNAIEKERSKSS